MTTGPKQTNDFGDTGSSHSGDTGAGEARNPGTNSNLVMKNMRTKLIILGLLACGALGWMSSALAQRATNGKKAAPAALSVDNTPVARDNKLTMSFAPVVKLAAPSVVNIYTTKTVKNTMPDMFNEPFFRRFFGDQFGGNERQPRTFKERSLGSGVIVTKDGYILTNNHVVDGADEVKVALAKDRKEFVAKVIGRDPKTDIAILKIEAKDLPYVTLADSDKLEVGDVVLAIGNPFGIGQTVTMGIVSATGRGGMGIEDYEDFIQTDAAINPGNSGGALIDAQGRLIGINTAILSRGGGNMGVGFAVPVNLARNVMDQLMNGGKVVRGFLGVGLQDLTPELAHQFNVTENGGALITEVTPNSAAGAAGLKPDDVITEFNGKPVQDRRSLKLMVSQTAPGSKVDVKVLRDGKTKTVTVTLKELTETSVASNNTPNAEDESEVLKGVEVGDIDAAVRTRLSLPADVKGAVVINVDPNSAAYEAGLRAGDVIQGINRKPVSGAEDAVKLSKNVTNKKVLVRVWSNGGSRYVVVDETKESSKEK